MLGQMASIYGPLWFIRLTANTTTAHVTWEHLVLCGHNPADEIFEPYMVCTRPSH